MQIMTVMRLAGCLLPILAVAGCALTDPLERAGAWHSRGSNTGNLAAQVVDPSDLVRGKESDSSNGVLAAMAIDRLYRDKVKDLPSTDFRVNGGGVAGSTGGGSGGTTGGSDGGN